MSGGGMSEHWELFACLGALMETGQRSPQRRGPLLLSGGGQDDHTEELAIWL